MAEVCQIQWSFKLKTGLTVSRIIGLQPPPPQSLQIIVELLFGEPYMHWAGDI